MDYERTPWANEVEEDGLRVLSLCLRAGGVQGFLGEAVDLAAKVKDDATRRQTHACLKAVSRHHHPFSGM